jgi:hypothetical protein
MTAVDDVGHRRQGLDHPDHLTRRQHADVGAPSTSAALVMTGRVGRHDHLGPGELVALLHGPALLEQRQRTPGLAAELVGAAEGPRQAAASSTPGGPPARCARPAGARRRPWSVTTVPVTGGPEVELLDLVGHPALGREQEAGAHGDAGGAVGQGGHQAPAVEEAAGGDDRHRSPTASTTWGSRSEVGTGPVWPPPSAPWAITASTPHSATFSAWRRAPTVGMTNRPASLQRPPGPGWAPGRSWPPGPRSRSSGRCARATSATSVRRLTPKGAIGAGPHLGDGRRQLGSVMVAEARMPRPPASAVAATRRGPATQPMPVWTMG